MHAGGTLQHTALRCSRTPVAAIKHLLIVLDATRSHRVAFAAFTRAHRLLQPCREYITRRGADADAVTAAAAAAMG